MILLIRALVGVLLAVSGVTFTAPPTNAQTQQRTPLCSTASSQANTIEVADSLVRAKLYDRAEELYKARLSTNPSDTCAARGLARISEEKEAATADTNAETAANGWDSFYADWVEPATRIVLPFLAVLLLLLVLARLATPFAVSTEAKVGTRGWRRVAWWVGVVLLILATVRTTIAATAGDKQSLTTGSWGPFAWVTWLFLAALVVVVAAGLAIAAYGIFRWQVSTPFITTLILGAIVLAGVGLTAKLDYVPSAEMALWILAAASASLGIYLVAATRGQDLRLQIQARNATGQTDASAADYVIARLQALGSGRPRGLEVPRQTDVTALPDEALSTLPQGAFAAALLRVLQAAVLPAIPWHATIAKVNDDTATVALTRNGRLADEAVINRHLLALPSIPLEGKGKERDDRIARANAELLTAAAGFILVALSRRHTELEKGLCGAHQWESVACHVLATERPLADDTSSQKELLAVAVDTDPHNIPARVAYLHPLGRRADERTAQKGFAVAMETEYQRSFRELCEERDKRQADQQSEERAPPAGFEALQLRMLFSIAAAWLNCYLLDETYKCALENAHNAARWLVRRLGKDPSKGNEKLIDFVAEMQAAAGYLWLGIENEIDDRQKQELPKDVVDHVKGWTSEESVRPLPPKVLYDRACWRARRTSSSDRDELSNALDDLELAIGLKDLRDWARRDPAFKALREDVDTPPAPNGSDSTSRNEDKDEDQARLIRQRYKNLVGDPAPAEFLALAPFAEYATKLHALGIHDAGQLHEETMTWSARWRLGVELGVGKPVIERWHRLTELARLDPGTLGIGTLYLLLAVKVDSLTALKSRGAVKLHEELRDAATDYSVLPPTLKTIEHWMSLATRNNETNTTTSARAQ